MFDRILVPLDGSELSKQVFPYVSELTKAFDSEVVLVSVCQPEETESLETCRIYIDGEADNLRRNLGAQHLKIKKEVLVGGPAELILDYAEKNNIGLIVISSHGRSGIRPWSVGSTANKILHKVGVPLIMIRAREEKAKSEKTEVFNRILVPLDGSPRSGKVLPYVAEVSRKLASKVFMLQVVEPGRHVRNVGGVDYVRFQDRDMNDFKRRAEEYLNEASSKFAAVGVEAKSEVRVGDSATKIIEFADEASCSIIAMSSHGHSGFESWMYGSVTYKVLQTSKQNVMLVPST